MLSLSPTHRLYGQVDFEAGGKGEHRVSSSDRG